jgi:hypothetical protein
MKGIKLTIEQKEAIQGIFYNENTFFNCVQDINNDWFLFLSESDKNEIESTQYSYLLSLSEFEYVPPIIENPFI